MAERPRLALVDRVFDSLPEPTDDTEAKRRASVKKVVASYVPSIIKEARPAILEEGKQLALKALGVQRVEEASQIAALKTEHERQLRATERLHGRGSAWRAGFFGILAGVIIGGVGCSYLLQQGWYAQVAAQRVPRANIPALSYEPSPDAYDHDRREPADASLN